MPTDNSGLVVATRLLLTDYSDRQGTVRINVSRYIPGRVRIRPVGVHNRVAAEEAAGLGGVVGVGTFGSDEGEQARDRDAGQNGFRGHGQALLCGRFVLQEDRITTAGGFDPLVILQLEHSPTIVELAMVFCG